MSNDVTSRLGSLSVEERNALAQRLFQRRGPVASAPPAIARRPSDGSPQPLSFAQQRFWFLNQLAPLNAAYTVVESNRLRGALDVPALQRAFAALVERHDVLRTVFETVEGRPMQRVRGDLPIAMGADDLRGRSDLVAALQPAVEEFWNRAWDLERGPLVRAHVWTLADADHLMLILVHHIISDGWSKAVLVRELTEIYAAFAQGRAHRLPPPPIQYADFAAWQHEWLAGDDAARQLGFWKQHMADPPVLQLPADGPAQPTAVGTHHTVIFQAELTQAIRAFTQREGVTLFMTMLAALATLLARYSSQPEIVVGTPTANRTRPELENLIGCFMNPLPVRVDVRGNPTFRELIGRVREASLGVFGNQEMPFDVLVRTLQPQRDTTAPPLFQAMLLLHNLWRSIDLTAGSLESVAYRIDDKELQAVDNVRTPGDLIYPVALEVTDLGAQLHLCFQYGHEFATVLGAMPGHFRALLTAALANPDVRVLDVPILSAAERRTLVSEWNHDRRDYPAACASRLFEAQVRRAPQAPAVICGDECVAYGELNARANRLARRLRAAGIGRESRVAILLDRSPRMYEAVLGVMKSGGAYVPLDPAYPSERLAFILGNAGVTAIVAEMALRDVVAQLEAARAAAPLPVTWIDAPESAGVDASDLVDAPDLQNLAYVIYTSGSTGTPKGTMVTHANLANAYHAWEESYRLLDGPRRHLQMASLSFDVFSGDLVRALCSGAALVIAPHDMLFAPQELYALMRRTGVDAAEFVPVVLRDMLAYLEASGQDLSFLQLLAAGSDTWYAPEYRKVRRFCGPRTRVVNSYGVTESTIDSTWFESDDLQGDSPVPLGRAFQNTTLYVLDPAGAPASIGAVGELFIGGAGVARGYLDQPALTAERFVPDPFSTAPGQRLYRTGDLARYLSNGTLEFFGRGDQQLKLRGFRIEPGEIEAVLSGDPSVAAAVVSVREDRPGDKRLVAYVVAADGESPRPADLRALARQRLPEYMVPSAIVVLDAWPLTPNGKIDRRALPAPDGTRQSEDACVAPRTGCERTVAEIWCEVLGLSRVSVTDNFFDLGGHSMLAVKVAARLERAFGVRVPVRIVFETRTLADQAARIELTTIAASGPIEAPADALVDEVVL